MCMCSWGPRHGYRSSPRYGVLSALLLAPLLVQAFANVCKFLDSLASGWEQAERHLEALGQTAVVLFPAPGAAIPDSISPPGKDVAFPVMHVSRLIASIEGVDAEC